MDSNLSKGCPGDKIRSGGKGRGLGVGQGKGPIGRQGGNGSLVDQEEDKKKTIRSKKKLGEKSGDNKMELKEKVKSLINEGKTKEDIKKAIAEEYFAEEKKEDIIKAEDIIKTNGEPFGLSDKFEKSMAAELEGKEVVDATAIPIWDKIPSVEYDYKKEEDVTIQEKKNAEHIDTASGMNRKVIADEVA